MRDVVITPMDYNGPRRSRNLQERLMVRFPSFYRHLVPLVFRLGPRSRLRRTLLRRAVESGWASFARRDLELNFLYFTPECEFELPPAMQTLGIPASFRGLEGRNEGIDKIFEVWGSELEPLYLLDLGDRLLNLGFWRSHGRASEVPLDQELAQLVTLRGGLIARDQNFNSWEEGLRAAGLEPDAIALPVRPRTSRASSSAA